VRHKPERWELNPVYIHYCCPAARTITLLLTPAGQHNVDASEFCNEKSVVKIHAETDSAKKCPVVCALGHFNLSISLLLSPNTRYTPRPQGRKVWRIFTSPQVY